MNRKNGKRILFVQMILPYICVLMILVLTWLASSTYSRSIIENKLISVVKGNIEGNIKVINSQLEQVEDVVFSLSQNKEFNKLYNTAALTYMEKKKYMEMLTSYHLDETLIEKIYIYSRLSDNVITETGVYNNPEEFFRYGYILSGETAPEASEKIRRGEWANGYSRRKLQIKALPVNEKMTGKTTTVLEYARIMPIERTADMQGVIGVVINEKQLLRCFDGLTGSGGVCVFNNNDEAVMTYGSVSEPYIENLNELEGKYGRVKINGEEFYRFVCPNTKNQWKYVVYITEDYVMKDMVVINGILNGINILALLIAIYLSVHFAYKRSKSTEQIMDMLGVEKAVSFKEIKLNEFELWKPHLEKLIDDKENMKGSAEKLLETRRSRALFTLLLEKQDEATSLKIAEDNELEFPNEKFTVMILKSFLSYNVDGVNNKNAFLKQAVEDYISEDFYMYAVDSKTTAVVINHNWDKNEAKLLLKERITRMTVDAFYRYNLKVVIGLSEESCSLTDLHNAYTEALEVVKYNELTNSNTVLFYGEMPINSAMYNYPIELENKFIRSVMAGKTEVALALIDEIYQKNFVECVLSVSRIEELFSEIVSSLNKVKRAYNNEDIAAHSVQNLTIQDFFDYIRSVVALLCEESDYMSECANQNLFAGVVDYINKNYQNSDLSLASIADRFGIGDITTVSKGIKAYANENFSSYLERVRIDNACRMIADGVRIKDIPEKVGYIADSTFRRAFKKRMGVSPTEYSKQLML